MILLIWPVTRLRLGSFACRGAHIRLKRLMISIIRVLTWHTCSGICMRMFSGTDDRAFTQRTRELYYTRQEFLHVAATFPLDSRATVEALLVRY